VINDKDAVKGKCPNCSANFEKRRSDQKFCSATCRIENWHFKTAGKKAIGDLIKRQEIIEHRLSRIEEKLGLGEA
jgi:endogenous inhibitor of DNA gyrase (YacG/DUF329 family)